MNTEPTNVHVALAHWTFAPTTGGVESHISDLARLLLQAGVRVTVLTGEPFPSPIPGVSVITFDWLNLGRVKTKSDADCAAEVDRVRSEIERFVSDMAIDVVHGHNLHHFSSAPALAMNSLHSRFRLFHTFHETWPDLLADSPVYRFWDGNFAVSAHVQRECDRRLGYKPELRQLGVDLERFAWTPVRQRTVPLRILHPARLLPWKGVHVSVRALAILRSEGIEARLTITDNQRIADWHDELSGYRQRILGEVQDLGVVDSVDFCSPTFEEMPSLYQDADVVVYPTVGEEPYGLVPLEAMSSGRPVVVSRSGGLTETIIDGETGFVVDRGDSVALASRLRELASPSGLRERMGRAGRAHVEQNFNAISYASKMLQRYTAPSEANS